MRLVFMGTPDFAVEPLRKLVEGGYNVVGVITMPDKPIGRHQTELSASPVKQYAVEHGLRVLQPAKLKDPAFVEELRSLEADLQIVVAFRMLPEVVWAMPRLGTFNLHAALLPQYRGAAPINWAIINGDTETGITTFFLDHEIDTGQVIQRVSVPILDTDNVEDVHDKHRTDFARQISHEATVLAVFTRADAYHRQNHFARQTSLRLPAGHHGSLSARRGDAGHPTEGRVPECGVQTLHLRTEHAVSGGEIIS